MGVPFIVSPEVVAEAAARHNRNPLSLLQRVQVDAASLC